MNKEKKCENCVGYYFSKNNIEKKTRKRIIKCLSCYKAKTIELCDLCFYSCKCEDEYICELCDRYGVELKVSSR